MEQRRLSDTRLAYDRDVKIPLYAKQGIAECWLLDVNALHLEMYRDPGAEGYRTLLRPDRDATVSPQAFPDAPIDLEELFVGLA
jgi:Uma2 family endonuclease